MSGHVPKFGGSNAGNFTEVFTLARGGGKAGSGDSAASQPEESGNGPVYSGRGGGSGGGRGAAAAAAPPRRESGSTRSSQEGSNRPSPPGRREPREPRESREQSTRTGVRGSQDKGRSHHAPRNEEYAGASHLPKFGEWNAGEGDTNYTVMFTAASKERKTGVAVDDAPMKGSGDPQSNSSRIPKKHSSCWSCF